MWNFYELKDPEEIIMLPAPTDNYIDVYKKMFQPTLMFYEFQKGATLLPIQFNSDFSIQGRGFSFSYAQVIILIIHLVSN